MGSNRRAVVRERRRCRTIDLRISRGRHVSTKQAADRILDYLAIPAVADAVADWPRMPPTVRDEVMRRYPLFGKLVEIVRMFPEVSGETL